MKTILVAHDDPASRELMRETLAPRGYHVRDALDGMDALDKASALRPDLILLDFQMPQLDGIGVVAQLRKDPRFATLPIIAMTALANPEDRKQVMAAEFTAQLPKPVDIRVFLQLIATLLG